MAGRYYEGTPRDYTNAHHSNNDIFLKPLQLAAQTSIHSVSSTGSHTSNYNASYNPVPLPHYTSQPYDDGLQDLEHSDSRLKQLIRKLRLGSRVANTLMSAATLGPLLATIIKFELTKNIYFDVDGKKRTAWAHDSITSYTFMYAGISGVSFVLNTAILLSYLCSNRNRVKNANRAATVASIWTYLIRTSHIVIWSISVAIYRKGKEPIDGKIRDLWGWTCSTTAQELQNALTSVNFDRYCTVQTTSFYTGIANAALSILSLAIFILAIRRSKSKNRVSSAQTLRISSGSDLEPLRTGK